MVTVGVDTATPLNPISSAFTQKYAAGTLAITDENMYHCEQSMT